MIIINLIFVDKWKINFLDLDFPIARPMLYQLSYTLLDGLRRVDMNLYFPPIFSLVCRW